MKRTLTLWARPLAGAMVVLLGLTLCAPPVAAGEPKAVRATSSSQPTLATAAAAKVAAMPVPTRALTQAAPAAPTEGKSFFKSPMGIIATVLLAGGIAYMTYSAVEDSKPVQSPVR